ncbi:PQQ-binding-like beta-propeller repeat protein [Vibrio stylophorae]|nr:PQQ-binding-like beta-propeller repeat protein [Vibrio stylophorae]
MLCWFGLTHDAKAEVAQSKENLMTPLWQVATEGQIWSSPAVEKGRIYVGSDDGDFYAIDQASQTVLWRFATQGKVRAAPALDAKHVYFSSDDGYLYALNKESGQEVWRFHLNDGDVPRIGPANHAPWVFDYEKSSPVLANGRLFIGSADQHFYAIDSQNGKQIWRIQTNGMVRATPSLGDKVVYISSWGGRVYQIDQTSGQINWQFDTGSPIVSRVVAVGDKLIVGARNGVLFALNAQGTEQWRFTMPEGSWVESSAVVDSDQRHFYLGTSDAKILYKFDSQTGKTIWQTTLHGWIWGTPLLYQGQVYIGASGAKEYWTPVTQGFFKVNTKTGHTTKLYTPASSPTHYVHGGVFATPAVQNNQLIVADLDGKVYGFALSQ